MSKTPKAPNSVNPVPTEVQVDVTIVKIPQQILDLATKVTAKRPKVMIDHIIKHGKITTDELKSLYGYNHPPRVAGDVKDHGIPVVMIRVKGPDGRSISAYTFGDPEEIKSGRIGGRKAFSKKFKAEVVAELGARCTLTGEPLEDRYLQIDHRIPYRVAGDDANNFEDVNAYMLLDASQQRAKSFSCENCENFKSLKKPEVCKGCFWAYPESYTHVAMEPKRMLTVAWSGKAAAAEFDAMKAKADAAKLSVQDYVKQRLK